jgi:hypothetical protein
VRKAAIFAVAALVVLVIVAAACAPRIKKAWDERRYKRTVLIQPGV